MTFNLRAVLLLAASLCLAAPVLTGCSDDSGDSNGDQGPIRPGGDGPGDGGASGDGDGGSGVPTIAAPGDSDGDGNGDGDGPTGGPGNGDGGADGPGTGNEVPCSEIPSGANLGQLCNEQPEDFCGQGGACVTIDASVPPTCQQICIPNRCTDTCQSAEVCVGLVGPDEQPITLDNGEPLGACVEPPAGEQGAYEACGSADTGACQAGLQCGAFEQGAQVGTCTPSCTGAGDTCPDLEGFSGTCSLTFEGGGMGCGLQCTPGAADGCPSGMSCVDLGGGGTCAR